MNIVQIDNWQDYFRDGEQFLKTANGAFQKKSKGFSTDTLYNVTCMAIEKLVMAFLMKNGDLADNHTMGDLLYALQRHLGNIPDIAEKLTYLDQFQEICSLENFVIQIPTEEEVGKFLAIAKDIQNLLHPYLTGEKSLSTH
jgi:HEPN domain-containing protein